MPANKAGIATGPRRSRSRPDASTSIAAVAALSVLLKGGPLGAGLLTETIRPAAMPSGSGPVATKQYRVSGLRAKARAPAVLSPEQLPPSIAQGDCCNGYAGVLSAD